MSIDVMQHVFFKERQVLRQLALSRKLVMRIVRVSKKNKDLPCAATEHTSAAIHSTFAKQTILVGMLLRVACKYVQLHHAHNKDTCT